MPPSTLKLASGPSWDWGGLVGQEAKWPPNQERPRSMVRPSGTDPCSSIAHSLHGSGPGCLPPCASLAVQLTLGQCSALGNQRKPAHSNKDPAKPHTRPISHLVDYTGEGRSLTVLGSLSGKCPVRKAEHKALTQKATGTLHNLTGCYETWGMEKLGKIRLPGG